MNVVVLLRPIHDAALAAGVTGSTIRLDDPSLTAFELARSLAALSPPAPLIALAAGPPEWDSALRDGLAMGAATIIRAWSPGIEEAEIAAVAAMIRGALPAEAHLVVCGAAATDHGSGALPAALAQSLGWPLLAEVTAVEDSRDGFLAQVRASGGRRQVYRLDPPAILVAAVQPVQPPYPPLARRLAAKRAIVPAAEVALPGRGRGIERESAGPAWPRRRHLVQPQASTRAADRLRSLMSAGISASKSDTIDAASAADTLATWLSEGGFLRITDTTEVTTL